MENELELKYAEIVSRLEKPDARVEKALNYDSDVQFLLEVIDMAKASNTYAIQEIINALHKYDLLPAPRAAQ
jgi:hypothetical protein